MRNVGSCCKVNDGSVHIHWYKDMGTGVNVQKRIVAMHHVDALDTATENSVRGVEFVR